MGAVATTDSCAGRFLQQEYQYSPNQVGLLFLAPTVPSLIVGPLAGQLGNRWKREWVILVALLWQGVCFILPPKSELAITIVTMVGVTTGMDIVDAVGPALLGQMSQDRHNGSGTIYALHSIAESLCFVFGPLLGTLMFEKMDFQAM